MLILIWNICGIEASQVLKLLNLVCPNVLQKYLVTGYTIDITCSTIINFRFLWFFFYFNDLRKLQIKWMTLKCFPPTFVLLYQPLESWIAIYTHGNDINLSSKGNLNKCQFRRRTWFKPSLINFFLYVLIICI